MSVSTALSTAEKLAVVKQRLGDPSPKCANCKYMRPMYRSRPERPKTMKETVLGTAAPRIMEVVLGKGFCMEPTAALEGPTVERPLPVTDLTLCSRWEPKE